MAVPLRLWALQSCSRALQQLIASALARVAAPCMDSLTAVLTSTRTILHSTTSTSACDMVTPRLLAQQRAGRACTALRASFQARKIGLYCLCLSANRQHFYSRPLPSQLVTSNLDEPAKVGMKQLRLLLRVQLVHLEALLVGLPSQKSVPNQLHHQHLG